MSICRLEEDRQPISPTIATTTSAESPASSDSSPANPVASLPSQTENQRSHISKRMARMMDTLLSRASIAGQHINIYTGTDYSGIEALRNNIIEQERGVRDSHKKVDDARSSHHEAHAKQASAQKEIVSLLERKSSWSPTDLERYMSLVRSEHTMEQAVQAAKDGLRVAERDLEDGRSLLERLERKQYHEEQVWSDTIRRNSTWVTFGLMGVNIVLLLAQIAVFEPYRRRKIVRDVQKALDEKTVSVASTEVERQIDEVVEPEAVRIEAAEKSTTPGASLMPKQPPEAFVPAKGDAGETPLVAGGVLPEEATHVSPLADPPRSQPVDPGKRASTWDSYRESFQDLFSEQIIQIKKVDLTTTALQGAATGVAAMGLLFVLFRPR